MSDIKKVRTQEEWLIEFKKWKESGLSIPLWCKQQNECFHSFKYWRRLLCGSYQNRVPQLQSIVRSSFHEVRSVCFR